MGAEGEASVSRGRCREPQRGRSETLLWDTSGAVLPNLMSKQVAWAWSRQVSVMCEQKCVISSSDGYKSLAKVLVLGEWGIS